MIEKEIIKDQKETIHRLQDECTEKTKIILKLHQENEQLKKEITTLECKLDAEKPSMIIPKPKQLAIPIEEVEKYIKALEEIRDIAGNIDDIDKWIEQNLMPSQVCERIEKINNKINEVLK